MTQFRRFLGFACLLTSLSWGIFSSAQEEQTPADEEAEALLKLDAFGRDRHLANRLVQWGLPDFAQIVHDQLAKSNPDRGEALMVIQASIHLAQRKLAEVEELLKKIPPTNSAAQSIRLRMASFHLAAGNSKEAVSILEGFFTQMGQTAPTDNDLREQYMLAIITLSNLYRDAGEHEKCANILFLFSKAKPPAHLQRKVSADRAYALLEVAAAKPQNERTAILDTVAKISGELQWRNDAYKGHAYILDAMVLNLRGKRAEAEAFLAGFTKVILEIEKNMRDEGVRMDSPFTASRLFLGGLAESDGWAVWNDKSKGSDPARRDAAKPHFQKALKHYVNAYIKNPTDDKGRICGMRYDELSAKLDKIGIPVPPLPVPSNPEAQATMAKAEMELAKKYHAMGKFAEAAKGYLKALNRFPETRLTRELLQYLLQCHQKLEDDLMLEVTGGYIVNRFAKTENMVAIAHSLAFQMIEAKKTQEGTNLVARIIAAAPQYSRTPSLNYAMAQFYYKDKRIDECLAAYQKVVAADMNSDVGRRAMSALATLAYERKQFDVAATNYAHIVRAAPEGVDKVNARTRLANCYLQLDQKKEALRELRSLVDDLDPKRPGSPYTQGAIRKTAEGLLQTNMYYLATVLSRLEPGETGVAKPGEAALEVFNKLLALFPNDPEATPKAMYGKGRMQIQLGLVEDASKTFDELSSKFPGSEHGKNALFAGARAAMEIKRPDMASMFVKKMLEKKDSYGPVEFVIVGNFLVENKLYEEGLASFQYVAGHANTATDPNMEQRALHGVAVCAHHVAAANKNDPAQIAASMKAVGALTNKYSKTGFLMDAALLQAANQRLKGDFDAAMREVKLVFENAHRLKDKKAEINGYRELARIQAARGEVLPAFGSQLTLVMTADPASFKKEELRPVYREAILEALEAGAKLPTPRPKDIRTLSEAFLEHFPGDDETERIQKIRNKAVIDAG